MVFGISKLAESEDEKNYYVDYAFNTFGIENNVWQSQVRQPQMTISKAALGGQDLGLYVAEEIGEVADYELNYLKEVQTAEREKGMTKLVASVDYTGLIGLILDVKDKILPGYEPVITEEICDGIDNDRDGLIDEDLGQTVCGVWRWRWHPGPG
ncbi:unnamed protein product [marine sediment metagenome]|uniref:Uncharacterized protein n=1 Tax=marine sediment metagenome TaxID=412755 RepID=X1AW81_9ZZZZ